MYQKCPICNGTGIAMTIQSSNSVCHTCQGKRIISELTGLPPNLSPNQQQVISSNSGSFTLNTPSATC
jgi:DnaJ-class molecular chaperone